MTIQFMPAQSMPYSSERLAAASGARTTRATIRSSNCANVSRNGCSRDRATVQTSTLEESERGGRGEGGGGAGGGRREGGQGRTWAGVTKWKTALAVLSKLGIRISRV